MSLKDDIEEILWSVEDDYRPGERTWVDERIKTAQTNILAKVSEALVGALPEERPDNYKRTDVRLSDSSRIRQGGINFGYNKAIQEIRTTIKNLLEGMMYNNPVN